MAMDKKQKTLLVLSIAAFGFLGYQVYSLVSSDLSQPNLSATSSSQVVSGPTVAALKPHAEFVADSHKEELTQNALPAASTVAVAANTEENSNLPSQSEVLAASQPPLSSSSSSAASSPTSQIGHVTTALHKQQHQYLQLVNQLQLAKMKHQLFAEEAAIASAQNRIAKLNKETRQLDGDKGSVGNNQTNAQAMDYHLSYIDRQNGNWSAALSYKGQYQEVQIGTVFADGIRVMNINHQGVTLQDGSKMERVTFNGVVPLATRHDPMQQPLFDYHQGYQKHHAALDPVAVDPKENPSKFAVFNSHVIHHDIAHIEADQPLPKPPLLSKLSVPLIHDPVHHHARMVEGKSAVSDPAPQKTPVDPPKKDLMLPPKKDPLAPPKKPTPPPPAKPHYSVFDKALLKLPPNHFTLQLVGSYHPFVIKDFILANDLSNKKKHEHYYIYYVYNGAGQRWDMLLFGNYSNIYFAQNALKHLPANMKTDDVIIRQLVDVQRDIRGRLNPV